MGGDSRRHAAAVLLLSFAALPGASAFGLLPGTLQIGSQIQQRGATAARAGGAPAAARAGGLSLRASTGVEDKPGLLVRSASAVRTWVSAKKRKLFQRNNAPPAVAPLAGAPLDDDDWHPDGKELQVFFDHGLGDGTYGQVFTGMVSSGPHKGEYVIIKRAKDGHLTPMEMRGEVAEVTCPRRVIGELSAEDELEILELAPAYLEVEAQINKVVHDVCPTAGAPFLGTCKQGDCTWLVWRNVGEKTLEHFLIIASTPGGSFAPLAEALGLENFVDGDERELKTLASLVGYQLLGSCAELEKAGISHRDVKPWNILVCEKEKKMRLCDFGSAAAMGREGRTGYDVEESPCDVRYCPPECFLVEENWPAYDTFSVGMILLRILMPSLREEEAYDKWSDDFHASAYDLDKYLINCIKNSPAVLPTLTATGMDQVYKEIALYLIQHPEIEGKDTALAGFATGLAALCNEDVPGLSLPLLRILLTTDAMERPAPSIALQLLNAAR